MHSFPLPISVCAVVAEVLTGSHATLEALFEAVGVPGPPPNLPHHTKWKIWLKQASNTPNVDSLQILGNLIEEFMDLPPKLDSFAGEDNLQSYNIQRERLVNVLEENGLRYYRGGRVLPNGVPPPCEQAVWAAPNIQPQKPTAVEELLTVIIRGLPRAIYPLAHRRKGTQSLSFGREYDIQDLLHSHLRPWIVDIRAEEFTPSYAGSSTRMDFLLLAHKLVIETKLVRDKAHASKIGDELIIDIEHYRRHPACDRLWCVVYDPDLLIINPSGIVNDLEGARATPDGSISVRVFVLSG